jgi:hypothetical protein
LANLPGRASHPLDYATLPGRTLGPTPAEPHRVIRTRQDRGDGFLIDDRFARPDALRLLPRWWEVRMKDK